MERVNVFKYLYTRSYTVCSNPTTQQIFLIYTTTMDTGDGMGTGYEGVIFN